VGDGGELEVGAGVPAAGVALTPATTPGDGGGEDERDAIAARTTRARTAPSTTRRSRRMSPSYAPATDGDAPLAIGQSGAPIPASRWSR
jgi:hypothetical protein